MFKAINAGSRQFRGPPGFPLDADPKRHLDIVWIRSMQFDDFALIVRLHNAYCMDRIKKRLGNFLMTPNVTNWMKASRGRNDAG